MKLSGVIFVFTVAFLLSSVSSSASQVFDNGVDQLSDSLASREVTSSTVHGEAPWPLGRISRLLAMQKHRVPMTCNHFPRICRAMGSSGPECCKKQCVNVMTDGRNCGQCGNKCRYGEACCRGSCVNIMYDRKNCGGCHKGCKGGYCRYGMCSYAN